MTLNGHVSSSLFLIVDLVDRSAAERRPVYQILPKLHLPSTPDTRGLLCLRLLLSKLDHVSV